MKVYDFHIKTDTWPLVSSNDELVIVHRYHLAIQPVVYIGAHKDCTVYVRTAKNRDLIESAAPWSTTTLPASGMIRLSLPGTADPLDVVSKITTDGAVFVCIASPGEFDAYFKQVNVA